VRRRLPAAAAEPVLSDGLSELTVAMELDELMPLSAHHAPDTSPERSSITLDDCNQTGSFKHLV